MNKPIRFTQASWAAACETYSRTDSKVAVADVMGVSVSTIHANIRKHPEFKEMMEHAHEQYVEKLENECHRRAVLGVTQTKPGPGGVMYEVTTYSDTLLLHMLKKADPAKHGDKMVIDQNVKHETEIGIESLSQEDRDRLRIVLENTTTDRDYTKQIEPKVSDG